MAGKRGKRFVSGGLTVDIKYNDRGKYVAKVCADAGTKSQTCERVVVGTPASSKFAVDSPRAMHDAAHAAISFSKLSDYADTNRQGSGWYLRKPRRTKRRR